MKKVCVLGLGYVGLPTAVILANHGYQVLGVDINQAAVEKINQGKTHIVEPDLDVALRIAINSQALKAALKPEFSDIFIIAVPTPFKENHTADLSYIEAAAKMIAPVLAKNNLIILESTSPVGATEQLKNWLIDLRKDLKFPEEVALAYCPERILPGKVMQELSANDRVIGGMTEGCAQKAQEFYQSFVTGECIKTNAATAELTKLTENSFRDVNIAFANELSLVCDRFNINVWELISLANRHPRVKILSPGPGVGGHCIAVDPWFIVSSAPEQAKLIRAAREVNDAMPEHVLDKIRKAAEKKPHSIIACLGLAFKKNIDDLRESPAMQIVSKLSDEAYSLMVVEPYIEQLPKSLAHKKNVTFNSLNEALLKADIIVLLVDHDSFCKLDKNLLANKIIIDTRGVWNVKN